MVYGSLVSALFLISFAYIMLILANKESGNMKLGGQIIAALIAIVAVVVLVFGSTGHGMMGRGKMCGCPMMGSEMKCGSGEKCMDSAAKTGSSGKMMMHKKTTTK